MQNNAFINYLIYFHCYRDYFECHEVLEEHWKAEKIKNKLWVGFIQLAVAMYHHRGNNFLGAKKQLTKAIKIFKLEEIQVINLGIDHLSFYQLLENKLAAICKNEAYHPINVPILDEDLVKLCTKRAHKMGALWDPHLFPITDNQIIHKHKLRDRSQIIRERQHQLTKRKKQ